MNKINLPHHFNGRCQVAFVKGARGKTAMLAMDCCGIKSESEGILITGRGGSEVTFPFHEIERIGINIYPKS